MGIEREQLRKKASRYFLAQLSSGQGMTIDEIVTRADYEFGLSRKWVMEFLDKYANGLKEENGVFKWKA